LGGHHQAPEITVRSSKVNELSVGEEARTHKKTELPVQVGCGKHGCVQPQLRAPALELPHRWERNKCLFTGGLFVKTPKDPGLSKMVTEEEIQFYVQQFKKSGFR
jgi:hypothetical protein